MLPEESWNRGIQVQLLSFYEINLFIVDQTTAVAFSEFDDVRAPFEKQLRDSLQQYRNGLNEDLGDDLDPSV